MSAQRIARGSMLVGAALCALAFLVVMLASSVPHVDRDAGKYWGARILPPGPAWTGLPLLRVFVAPDGTLAAVPIDLHWLQYDGQADAPGLRASYAGNDTFRYRDHPEKLRSYGLTGVEPWWVPRLGQTVRADDFDRPWQGAHAVWGTTSDERSQQIPVVIVRVDPQAYPETVRERFAASGFIAFAASDPRNGCVLTYDLSTNPRASMDGRALLWDSCHDSRYDPQDIREYPLSALHEPWR